MQVDNERIVKKGAFQRVSFSSSKRFSCDKGELILTEKHLQVNCEGSWFRTFPRNEIRIEVHGKTIEIYDRWYNRLLFRIIVSNGEEWTKAYREMLTRLQKRWINELQERREKSQDEWNQLFELPMPTLMKLYTEIRDERNEFRRKNISFNFDVQRAARTLRNRKLKAFVIAHSYVSWYEWTKGILSKIYKAKLGCGPKNGRELLKFIREYPSLNVLNTREWEIEANQIRNCVAHENFYYDYRSSNLVFIVDKKEKMVRLRQLELSCSYMSNIYQKLLNYLVEKITKGKISSFF